MRSSIVLKTPEFADIIYAVSFMIDEALSDQAKELAASYASRVLASIRQRASTAIERCHVAIVY
jgi:hypothetical protein